MIDLTKLKLYGVLLLIVVAAGFGLRAHWRADGALAVKLASAESLAIAQTRRGDSIQAHYRVDTVKLTRQIVRAETTLTRLIDTAHVYHTDTVKVPVTVLVQADSTIRYCKVVLSDCETGWDAEKALNATLRRELALVKAQRPSTVRTVLRGVLWAGGGYLVGRVVH